MSWICFYCSHSHKDVENICNHCGSVKSDPKNKRMKPDSQPKRIVEQPQIVYVQQQFYVNDIVEYVHDYEAKPEVVEKLENEDPKGFVAFTWRILLFIFIGIINGLEPLMVIILRR